VLCKLGRKRNARTLHVHDEVAANTRHNNDLLAGNKAQILKVTMDVTRAIVKLPYVVNAIVSNFRQNHDASFHMPCGAVCGSSKPELTNRLMLTPSYSIVNVYQGLFFRMHVRFFEQPGGWSYFTQFNYLSNGKKHLATRHTAALAYCMQMQREQA
jgi:hypothetical protein